jgi:hypothetical protein
VATAGKVKLSALRDGGRFISAPKLRPTGTFRIPDRRLRPEYVVEEPIVFEIGARGSGMIVVVPAGYVTDGYSLPGRLLQLFQPDDPLALLAAALHDGLYSIGLVPRDMCDRVLLEGMRATEVPPILRFIVYRAVRFGGAGGYGKPETVNLDVVAHARREGLGEALTHWLKENTHE